jgi:phosphoribosylformimino-5-aminoimidazole carboxamide ribotide isomerase
VEGSLAAETVYSERPDQVAADLVARGAAFLHIVDLDGAFAGEPKNAAVIRSIAAAVCIPFQVGGGLRSLEAVEQCLQAGASRVVIGTQAVTDPGFVSRLIAAFGPERIVLGLDARDGRVAIQGWTEKTTLSDVAFGRQLKAAGVTTAIYTDISRDGKLQGPNFAGIARLAGETGLAVIASGGVTSREDVRRLRAMPGVTGAVIGKALYDGRITLEAALAEAEGAHPYVG